MGSLYTCTVKQLYFASCVELRNKFNMQFHIYHNLIVTRIDHVVINFNCPFEYASIEESQSFLS